jgi:hypothetical protein
VQSVRPKRYNKHLRLSTAACDTSAGTQGETSDDEVTENENFEVINRSLTSQIKDNTGECNQNNKECRDGNNIQEKEQSEHFPEIAEDSAENSATDNSSIEDLIAQVLFHHHDEKEVNDSDDNGWDPDSDTEDEFETSEEDPFVDINDGKESGEEPIYYGHSMPVRISMLLILLYCVTHGVSGSQLDDLLTLIGVHCLEAHPGLKSLFHFKKYFANIKSPLVKHYYCTHCLTFLDTTMETCPNRLYKKSLKDIKAKSYFLEIPIESQLRNFFNRPGFTDHLKSRFKRKQSENIEDIYDGKIYKSMSADGGPLSESHPYNISFTLNTDGVPIFKSSKFSIWPVYLMINELPFKLRKQSENMVFCGLWFGDVKPFMATFSQPLHKSLKKLEEDGISITNGEENITCKAFLICITADLPARSILLNMNQFNGAFCCVYCLEKGRTFQTKKKGSVHVFPFNAEQPHGYLRTHDGSIADAVKAVNTCSTVQGIKGPSFLMCLNSFDYVKGTCIDYMHGVLLGITKLLINLWISPSYSKEDFSVASFSEVIDSRLLQIKPPSFITRVPRSISSHFKYWKASELRSWLLFYSVPVLQDILHENYLFHYSAFVQAIHCLSGNSIASCSLDHAEKLLAYFVMTFPALYGERYQTLNLHSLLHLSECVRNLGPLWAYSCFPFETANGYVTKLFHGTQHVDMQILSSVNVIQMLPELISSVPHLPKISKSCSKILSHKNFKACS